MPACGLCDCTSPVLRLVDVDWQITTGVSPWPCRVVIGLLLGLAHHVLHMTLEGPLDTTKLTTVLGGCVRSGARGTG